MGLLLLPARRADIIYGFKQLRVDVAVVGRRWPTADIGAGRHDGLLETKTQLLGERLAGDPDGDRPVVGDKVGGKVDGIVENHRQRLCRIFDEVPSHVGHIPDISLQARLAVDKADESLGIAPLLDFIHFRHSLGVGGIAAYAPDGVGRIEDDAATAHHLHCHLDVFVVIAHELINYFCGCPLL